MSGEGPPLPTDEVSDLCLPGLFLSAFDSKNLEVAKITQQEFKVEESEWTGKQARGGREWEGEEGEEGEEEKVKDP